MLACKSRIRLELHLAIIMFIIMYYHVPSVQIYIYHVQTKEYKETVQEDLTLTLVERHILNEL